MRYAPPLGFTLIETLVVIAIIGTLSSIVISALNTSRLKANDAAIMQQVADIRPASEVVYDTTNSYDSVCDPTARPGELFRAAVNLSDKEGNSAVCIPSGLIYYYLTPNRAIGTASKSSTPGKWAAMVHLYSGKYFCVDYQGRATTTNTPTVDSSDVDC